MVDKLKSKYIFKKRNVYYFSKHVPQDLLSCYNRKIIVFSLKTRSVNHVSYLSKSYSTQLENKDILVMHSIGHFQDGTKEAIMSVHTLSNGQNCKDREWC